MGIVLQIIRTAREYAIANNAEVVHSLTLQVGEASGIITHYVEEFWEDAVPDQPLFKECRLQIEEVPAKALCVKCGHLFRPGPIVQCPECKSKAFRYVEGNTMMIKDMIIE